MTEQEDLPPPRDKATLKSAMRAFRKRMKLTCLDDESKLGSALSGGRSSSIAGIKPPDQFPKETWEELVRQGRLADMGEGTYGLVD